MNESSAHAQQWITDTLRDMPIEKKVAHLLVPTVGHDYERWEEVRSFHEQHGLGGVFVAWATAEKHRRMIGDLQAMSDVPLLIAADLECGAGHLVQGGVPFPDPLALAAADDEQLAYTLGKAAALEGRHVGIQWTYAPVSDVNVNPDNPIANTRSLGDDPGRVAQLAAAMVRGMQEHGLAACAKHFPGDGIDDLDQHAVTSVNSLSRDEWNGISGRAFRGAFDAGAWSTMIGHIALPAWDPDRDERGAYRPATVSRRITTDLLRGELGFKGLAVTDDMNMGGVAGYMNRRDRTVACITAGCDMLLFPQLPGDYETLLAAARSGELPAERLDEAVRRILAMKTHLGLHRGEYFGRAPTPDELRQFREASERIAQRAVHRVRDFRGTLPLRDLPKGARVMTITLSMENMDVPEVDAELTRRGYQVEHLLNPNDFRLFERLPAYDAVFVNFIFKAGWAIQSVRSVGPHNRIFLGGFFNEHPRPVFTSFGSPYHLRMFNTLPNYVNVHSATPDSQRAAVAAWFGDLPLNGHSPVSNLTRA